MTWARLDDGFPEHPKVLPLTDGAFRVHITAICYCARNDTDGVIIRAALAILRAKSKHVTELLEAALWEPHPAGWLIHDYLLYNRSRADVAEERERKAQSGRLGGQRKAENLARATAGASPPASGKVVPPSRPVLSATCVADPPTVVPPKKKPSREILTAEKRERLLTDFAVLGYIPERLEEAAAHPGFKRCTDEYLYFRGWLRRDLERMPQKGNTNGRTWRSPDVANARSVADELRAAGILVEG